MRSVSRERERESFGELLQFWGEDGDLGQTIIKGKNRHVADSAKREKKVA